MIFVIEGREWSLYEGTMDSAEIKKAFIECATTNEDGCSNYKYIGLTDKDNLGVVDTLAVTFNNKFIIAGNLLVDKCTFPVSGSKLYDIIIGLAEYYEGLGYEIKNEKFF